MVFDYLEVTSATAQIDIDDIGNCALLNRSLLGEEKYLVIKTDIGLTQVVQFGPIVPDCDELPQTVYYSYQKFDANETKVIKIIKRFISDAAQMEETTIEYIKSQIVDLLDVLEQPIC